MPNPTISRVPRTSTAAERQVSMTELNGSSRIQDGSAEGLLQFLDYVVNKGYGTAAAVNPWRSAVRRVLHTVEGDDSYGNVDVRSLDLDDYLSRFETKALGTGKVKVESAQAYRRRFTNALEAYLAFIDEGKTPSFRQGQRRPKAEPAPRSSGAESTADRAPAQVPGQRMIEYPFPLKSGQVAILRLPARLEKADAERLSAFVRTLVLEPPLELTSGTMEEAE